MTDSGVRPRRVAFGRASEEPYRRRPSDLVRLVCAAVLLTFLVTQATRPAGTTELNTFVLLTSLPRGLAPVSRALEGLGTLWIVALVTGASLVGRRWRLARDLILSGLLAWAGSRVLGSDVVGRIGLPASLRTLTQSGVTPSFPFVRVSVVVAVVTTASPYVSRPSRRLGQVLIVALVLAGVYLGRALPDDVLGGLVVGWGIGAAIHLIFGSPGGRPSSRQLEISLAQVGITARSIRLAAEQTADATVFDCDDELGRLQVEVIGRDERDAQVLAKTWRFLAYKDPSPPLRLNRVHQVEHEACMTLLAGAAGIPVPEVVFVGRAGPGAGLLVLRPRPGRSLIELDPLEVSDALLADIWILVAKLHGVGIAHGALDARHIVVTGDEPSIASFATASNARLDHRRANDVAELLAATAAVVGDQRAIAACIKTLDEPSVLAALPFLQPAALRPATRAGLSGHRRGVQQRLDELRSSAASAVGVKPPALHQLQRLRPSSALLAVSSLVAVGVLLDQVGNPSQVWTTVGHAQWSWAAIALGLSLATNVPYAVALMGTLPLRLPLVATTELQLAMSYSNLVIPLVGGTGFQIRFLQRQGADLPAAVAAGGPLSLAGTVFTELPLFALALWFSPHELHLGNVSVNQILKAVLLLVFVLGAAAAVALGIPRLRRLMLPPLREAGGTIWTALRSPRQLALLVGGNVLVAMLYALCLLCCLLAFGGSISFWSVLAVSIFIGSLVALVPIPGGGSAAGAVGLTAALVGLGVRTEVAVATTLLNQLVVSYLPAIPGWFATRHLLQQSDL